MVGSGSQTQADGSEYDAIESALAESERGRRFLSEHARRHRGADTDTLLQAIHRLEGVVTREAAPVSGGDALRAGLAAMAERIARMRGEIAATAEGQAEASAGLDTLVRGAERATSEILGAAEAIQEAAWSLREKGADGPLCDALDRRTITIYTACSAQDLAAQRSGLVVAALREVEGQIAALIGEEAVAAAPVPPPAAFAAPPPLPLPEALPEEHDLDFVPSQDQAALRAEPEEDASAEPEDDASAEPDEDAEGEAVVAPAASEQPAVDPDDLALAFADLDSLSIEEKIALFS